MSLYRYIETRDQLEIMIVDLVLAKVALKPPAAEWSDAVSILAEEMRRALTAHPATATLVVTHRFTSANGLRWAEALLTALTAAGLTGKQRYFAFRTLVGYVVGAFQTEYTVPFPRETAALPAELRADEFPLLAENARDARRVGFDDEFRYGLGVVLDGLAHSVRRSSKPRGRL
ncbi:TetR/AcrR family transcriptional regulator C-terminal domain-containing protein [Yinghuangia aomiensis]|uniref:TetR/AcrR family transcriptional regulator C-terminal domain-containing protein n=2 Tax=Yinghuangia aomiensis TaxID=676205 RepID=A0ABP9HU62_9ACTN